MPGTELEAEGLVMSKTKPSIPMGQSLERARLTKEVITAEGTKYYINNNEEGLVSVWDLWVPGTR